MNLDSHDDMGVPPASLGLTSRDAATLEAACDVGTWIIPLVAAGALSTVVWVTQYGNSPDCSFDCLVHQCAYTGMLSISGDDVPLGTCASGCTERLSALMRPPFQSGAACGATTM